MMLKKLSILLIAIVLTASSAFAMNPVRISGYASGLDGSKNVTVSIAGTEMVTGLAVEFDNGEYTFRLTSAAFTSYSYNASDILTVTVGSNTILSRRMDMLLADQALYGDLIDAEEIDLTDEFTFENNVTVDNAVFRVLDAAGDPLFTVDPGATGTPIDFTDVEIDNLLVTDDLKSDVVIEQTDGSGGYVEVLDKNDVFAGDVAGVWNALTIQPDAVVSSMIDDETIVNADIANNTIAEDKLAINNGPSDNYVITWNATGSYMEWVENPNTLVVDPPLSGAGLSGDPLKLDYNATNFNVTVGGEFEIADDGVALATETTGNYVATLADAGGLTVANSGTENAAVTAALDMNHSNTWVADQNFANGEIELRSTAAGVPELVFTNGGVDLAGFGPNGTGYGMVINDNAGNNMAGVGYQDGLGWVAGVQNVGGSKMAGAKNSGGAVSLEVLNGTNSVVIDENGTVVASASMTAPTFNGDLNGNASTATALETARDFSVSGDATTAAAVSFDGTGNVDLAISLGTDVVDANELVATGVAATSYGVAGTFPTFTVDEDGRLTAAGTQAETDPVWVAAEPNFANLTEDETITGNWVNTTNPWADNEVADDLTINGGTIDATVIGGTTPAEGTFTNLRANGTLYVNNGTEDIVYAGNGHDDEGYLKTAKGGMTLVTLGSTDGGTKGAVSVGTDDGTANWRASMFYSDATMGGLDWTVGAGDFVNQKGAAFHYGTGAANETRIAVYDGSFATPTFKVDAEGDVTGTTFTQGVNAVVDVETNTNTGDVQGDYANGLNIQNGVIENAMIANDAVTLGTQTTGNYVATLADAGGLTIAGSGSETAAVTAALDMNHSNTWVADQTFNTLYAADGDIIMTEAAGSAPELVIYDEGTALAGFGPNGTGYGLRINDNAGNQRGGIGYYNPLSAYVAGVSNDGDDMAGVMTDGTDDNMNIQLIKDGGVEFNVDIDGIIDAGTWQADDIALDYITPGATTQILRTNGANVEWANVTDAMEDLTVTSPVTITGNYDGSTARTIGLDLSANYDFTGDLQHNGNNVVDVLTTPDDETEIAGDFTNGFTIQNDAVDAAAIATGAVGTDEVADGSLGLDDIDMTNNFTWTNKHTFNEDNTDGANVTIYNNNTGATNRALYLSYCGELTDTEGDGSAMMIESYTTANHTGQEGAVSIFNYSNTGDILYMEGFNGGQSIYVEAVDMDMVNTHGDFIASAGDITATAGTVTGANLSTAGKTTTGAVVVGVSADATLDFDSESYISVADNAAGGTPANIAVSGTLSAGQVVYVACLDADGFEVDGTAIGGTRLGNYTILWTGAAWFVF